MLATQAVLQASNLRRAAILLSESFSFLRQHGFFKRASPVRDSTKGW